MAAAVAPRPGHTQLRVGRLTKAHGLKGAIKIELYTDQPDKRFVPGASFTLQVPTSSPWHGKSLELLELKYYNLQPVAFFAGVTDRTTAESLIKAILWVDQDLAEREDDAWYDAELVGLAVLRDGERIGTLTAVQHLPGQDVLTVDTGEREVLVPFVKAIVTAVDVKGGTVTVDPPFGLFEELPDDEPAPTAAPVPTAEPGDDSEPTAEPGDEASSAVEGAELRAEG